MKQIFSILLVFQYYAMSAADSLVFRNIIYSKLFETAKNEKKAVLLYFHFEGCGICKHMEKTAFIDNAVAEFYNLKFVCAEIDILKKEGQKINEMYGLASYPTFIYLDENAKVLHKVVGGFTPPEFIEKARIALNARKNLAFYADQYKGGNRTPDFLFDFSHQIRDANEKDSSVINDYINTQTVEQLATKKNIRYLYEFSIYQYGATLNEKGFQFMLNNRAKFYPYFEKDQIDTRLVSTALCLIQDAIQKQNELKFDKACNILSAFEAGKEYDVKDMEGNTIGVIIYDKEAILLAKINFDEKAGNTQKLDEHIKELTTIIWNDANALNSFAWSCYESSSGKVKLKTAIDCSKRSIELNNTYTNNDTYAHLLYKSGDLKNATIWENKAIEIAKLENPDFIDTTSFLSKDFVTPKN